MACSTRRRTGKRRRASPSCWSASSPRGGGRSNPAARRALKPGGAAAISFNTLTLRKDTLLTLLQNAGFTPLTEPPYDDFSHFVEQAVHRDFIVARNEQP